MVVAGNFSLFVSSVIEMHQQKAFEQAIANLPEAGGVEDGDGNEHWAFLSSRIGMQKTYGSAGKGIARLPRGACRTVMARNLSFLVSSLIGMRRTYRHSSRGIARLP